MTGWREEGGREKEEIERKGRGKKGERMMRNKWKAKKREGGRERRKRFLSHSHY